MFTIGQLFTKDEIKKAMKIVRDNPQPNDLLKRDVLTPEVMARIDETTGQENNIDYLCYALQYAFQFAVSKGLFTRS